MRIFDYLVSLVNMHELTCRCIFWSSLDWKVELKKKQFSFILEVKALHLTFKCRAYS